MWPAKEKRTFNFGKHKTFSRYQVVQSTNNANRTTLLHPISFINSTSAKESYIWQNNTGFVYSKSTATFQPARNMLHI